MHMLIKKQLLICTLLWQMNRLVFSLIYWGIVINLMISTLCNLWTRKFWIYKFLLLTQYLFDTTLAQRFMLSAWKKNNTVVLVYTVKNPFMYMQKTYSSYETYCQGPLCSALVIKKHGNLKHNMIWIHLNKIHSHVLMWFVQIHLGGVQSFLISSDTRQYIYIPA